MQNFSLWLLMSILLHKATGFIRNSIPSQTSRTKRSVAREDNWNSTSVREKVIYADEMFDLPTPQDIAAIEKYQLNHPIQTFAIGHRCVHGYPQAYGNHPVAHKINSGLFRLTCPLLVQAIDTWEGEGGVREISDVVRSSKLTTSTKKKSSFMEKFQRANKRTVKVRKSVIESYPGGWEKVQTKLGQKNADRFLESGIAGLGVNSGLADVKCLHAHVADHLCRSEAPIPTADSTMVDNIEENSADTDSTLGYEILRRLLEQRGVSIDGKGETCWKQCGGCSDNGKYEEEEEDGMESVDWQNYIPKKNRQKLRSTRKRRREIRTNE